MGFDWGRALTGVATLGGSEILNGVTNGGLYGGSSSNSSPQVQQYNPGKQMDYRNPAYDMYGKESENLGKSTEQYMDSVRGNLNKNVANADYANNVGGRNRALQNAKAGLSGADNSASDEHSRRMSIYGAAGINETAKRSANETYGKAIGNIATGSNKLKQLQIANDIASMPTPVPQNQDNGILGSLLSGWV
jgi:hypothetical protein